MSSKQIKNKRLSKGHQKDKSNSKDRLIKKHQNITKKKKKTILRHVSYRK